MIVLPDTEDRMMVSSFLWLQYWDVTDGQTDRNAVAITALALRAMRTRCKNEFSLLARSESINIHDGR